MKSTLAKMMLNPDFAEWFKTFQESANYYVASSSDSNQVHALNLCIAYAYESALKSKEKPQRE